MYEEDNLVVLVIGRSHKGLIELAMFELIGKSFGVGCTRHMKVSERGGEEELGSDHARVILVRVAVQTFARFAQRPRCRSNDIVERAGRSSAQSVAKRTTWIGCDWHNSTKSPLKVWDRRDYPLQMVMGPIGTERFSKSFDMFFEPFGVAHKLSNVEFMKLLNKK